MENMQDTFEAEIEKKIQQMESSSYQFPKRFSNADYIFMVGVVIVCLAGVIAGAFI